MYSLRDAVKRRMVMGFDAMPAEEDVIPRLCREHITTFYRDVPLPQ